MLFVPGEGGGRFALLDMPFLAGHLLKFLMKWLVVVVEALNV